MPTSPARAPRPAEPKLPRSDAKPNQSKTPFDNLEQELASLLGRPRELIRAALDCVRIKPATS